MKIRTNHHATHTLTTDAGVDLQLAFEPVGDPLVHETGDTIVVAYMVQDHYCENPMDTNGGEGVLHMRRDFHRRSYGSDNPEVLGALGLQSDGTPDIDAEFPAAAPWIDYNGIQQSRTTLRDLAADEFAAGLDANGDFKQRWVESTEGDALVEGQDYTIDTVALRATHGVGHGGRDRGCNTLGKRRRGERHHEQGPAKVHGRR